jgi:Leucine-rich repeat (LRR) protein
VSKLSKLEHLTMKHNQVASISSQLRNMASLRTLNLRYNNLTHTSIPPEIFENEELTTLGRSICLPVSETVPELY